MASEDDHSLARSLPYPPELSGAKRTGIGQDQVVDRTISYRTGNTYFACMQIGFVERIMEGLI
jgi:hypothetical protein